MRRAFAVLLAMFGLTLALSETTLAQSLSPSPRESPSPVARPPEVEPRQSPSPVAHPPELEPTHLSFEEARDLERAGQHSRAFEIYKAIEAAGGRTAGAAELRRTYIEARDLEGLTLLTPFVERGEGEELLRAYADSREGPVAREAHEALAAAASRRDELHLARRHYEALRGASGASTRDKAIAEQGLARIDEAQGQPPRITLSISALLVALAIFLGWKRREHAKLSGKELLFGAFVALGPLAIALALGAPSVPLFGWAAIAAGACLLAARSLGIATPRLALLFAVLAPPLLFVLLYFEAG